MTEEENQANSSETNEEHDENPSEANENNDKSSSEDNENIDENPSESNEDNDVNPSEANKNNEANPSENNENNDVSPQEDNENIDENPSETNENNDVSPSENKENNEANPSESNEDNDVNPSEANKNNEANPPENNENNDVSPQEDNENHDPNPPENYDANSPEDVENNEGHPPENVENNDKSPSENNENNIADQSENNENKDANPKESHENNEVEATKRRQEFFERIIENAPSMIIGVDLQGDIMFFNTTSEYITGYKNDEVLGKNFLSLLLQKKERKEISTAFNDIVEGKGICTIENLMITKEGDERLISWSIGAAINNENMIIGGICIGNDITDREVIQEMEELRLLNTEFEDNTDFDDQGIPISKTGPLNESSKTKDEWENVFNSISDPIIIVSKENRILNVNFAFANEMNAEADELIGKKCCEIFHEENSPIHSCVHKITIQSEEPETDEVYDPRSGTTTLISCSPYYNENGKLMGSVLIAKEVKGSIGTKNAKEADKMIGIRTLVSAIQHEIHNPLGGVLGTAEAIFEEENLIKIRIYSKDIIEASRRLSELSDSLATSIQKTSGPEMNAMDLNDFIKSSLTEMRRDKKFEKVEVECDLKPIPNIQGNPAEILEVFVNIISNSIESMEGPGKIMISTRKSNGNVQMVFTDNGAGIPKEHLSRIFDPLFAVENEDVRDEAVSMKTGLRMYVVSSILKKYNAPINIESEAGVGTSYVINFPSEGETEQNT